MTNTDIDTSNNTTTTWRPDQGEHPRTIVGTLTDVRTAAGSYGDYPLLELEEDGGVAWSIHCFRDVLRSELTSVAPQIGDKLSIAYLGIPPGKNYHLYKVRRVAGEPRKIDWSRFGAETPVEPDIPVDDAELKTAPARGIAERVEAVDDDIPF